MQLGIVGLPQCGKTTLFNALTRGDQPTTMSGGRFEVHTAVVDVPDERVERLSAMFKPQRTIYAKTTYVDIAGLEGGGEKGESAKGFSGPLLNKLSQMDGFILVLRRFEDANVAHPFGSVDAQRDFETIEAEFLLNDLIMVERKLERVKEEVGKQGGREKERLAHEMALFEKLSVILNGEQPLRTIELSPEEARTVSSFGFLTLKPILVVQNLGEGQPATPLTVKHPQGISEVAIQGRLEMDMAQLSPEDAAMFMQEYGISELSLVRVIRLSYDLLNLQSFFTVGEDEVRAWTVRRGASAWEAAGAIHTDLQKGFIRAEVVPYHELVALGGLAEARTQGKLRLEGKQYVVQDGDIVHIRFNL